MATAFRRPRPKQLSVLDVLIHPLITPNPVTHPHPPPAPSPAPPLMHASLSSLHQSLRVHPSSFISSFSVVVSYDRWGMRRERLTVDIERLPTHSPHPSPPPPLPSPPLTLPSPSPLVTVHPPPPLYSMHSLAYHFARCCPLSLLTPYTTVIDHHYSSISPQ